MQSASRCPLNEAECFITTTFVNAGKMQKEQNQSGPPRGRKEKRVREAGRTKTDKLDRAEREGGTVPHAHVLPRTHIRAVYVSHTQS